MELEKFSKATETFIKIGVIIGAISAISGGFLLYQNNIWIPSVTPISVDYDKGIAKISYKNVLGKTKDITIYGNASFILGGNWGIQFGTTDTANGSKYDRLELVKNGMVKDYIINNNK